jgi:hypothetical protein
MIYSRQNVKMLSKLAVERIFRPAILSIIIRIAIQSVYEREGANMSTFIAWAEAYHTQILTGGFFALLGIQLVAQLVVAHRVSRIRRQIQAITEQVQHYLQVIMEGENSDSQGAFQESKASKANDEEDSRLIAAVLREIFP